jgi:hypothetical protein
MLPDNELSGSVGHQVGVDHLHRVPRHAGRHLCHQEVHRVPLHQHGNNHIQSYFVAICIHQNNGQIFI